MGERRTIWNRLLVIVHAANIYRTLCCLPLWRTVYELIKCWTCELSLCRFSLTFSPPTTLAWKLAEKHFITKPTSRNLFPNLFIDILAYSHAEIEILVRLINIAISKINLLIKSTPYLLPNTKIHLVTTKP